MSATQPRPGSVVTVRTTPPPRSVPTDTGIWFVAGFSDRGPLTPVLLTSLQDFITQFGARQTYSPIYDALETFFREGGNRVYMSRVVGPSPVVATVGLDGSTAGAPNSLTVTAKGPGTYANTLRITVTGGGTTNPYTIQVSDTVLGILETSPSLADQNAAVAWSQSSQYVNIALAAEVSNPVAISNAVMAGGTDDRVNATDTQWLAALTRFTKDLGPGQVTQVGRTTSQSYIDTLAHAAANNRTAILDLPDSPTVATLTAAASAQRGTNDTYGAFFGPWVVIPGLVPGTTRIVPPSALVCGKIGKNEAGGASPNVPAAGYPEGASSFVIGLSQPTYDSGTGPDVTRDAMYALGVNQIVFRYNNYEVFGWRSIVDPLGANADWVNLGNVRLRMAMVAKSLSIMENYILQELDGQGRLFAKLNGQLSGMCSDYFVKGSLYGVKPEDAFVVDTGPTVNTPTTIGNRELHAAISARMSPDAELVVVEIAKVPVTQNL